MLRINKTPVFSVATMFLLLMTVQFGCKPAAKPQGNDKPPSKGPHGGALVKLGQGDYYAEALLDDFSHCLTIHILDSTAKKELAIAQSSISLEVKIDDEPMQYDLEAASEDNDQQKSSEFLHIDEEMAHALEGGAPGKLTVTIDEKTYAGTIDLHQHSHDHGHPHKH